VLDEKISDFVILLANVIYHARKIWQNCQRSYGIAAVGVIIYLS